MPQHGEKVLLEIHPQCTAKRQRAQIRAGESQEGRPLRRHRKHEQSLSFCTNASLAKVTALKDGKKCRRRNSWQQNHTFMTARRGSLASSHWTSWLCQSSPLLLLLARKDMGTVVVQRFLLIRWETATKVKCEIVRRLGWWKFAGAVGVRCAIGVGLRGILHVPWCLAQRLSATRPSGCGGTCWLRVRFPTVPTWAIFES